MSFAFQDEESPPLEVALIAEEIVKKCEGLPLTLEVLGQWLKRTKDEEDWRQTLDALDKAESVKNINERLWAKLRPSIDGLEENEKQMFLDATTFFHNDPTLADRSKDGGLKWTLRDAQAAWREAYGVNERLMWRTLVERSLVYKVEENEPIKVHEQLRSLGRKIASEFSEHSKFRVLDISAASKLLQSTNELDKKNIPALRLVRGHMIEIQTHMEEIRELQSAPIEEDLRGVYLVDGEIHVSSHTLQKLERLRYLEVDISVVVDGVEEATCFPSSLVVFKSVGRNVLNFAHQRRPVVLKIVNHDLKRLPKSIGQLSALRILVLSVAKSIETVPDEIGDLKQLEFLYFRWCRKLQTLPQRFGQLSKLKVLKLVHCERLSNLPTSFGNLSALEHIEIRDVGLEALPESVGQLSALRSLEIWHGDQVESLPESFGLLSALVELKLHCRGLKSLPKTFGQLSALSRLEMSCCDSLESLPESFGKLPVLSHLELSDCYGISSLPKSFGQLGMLQYLRIIGLIELERLPGSFAELVALRHLIIQECSSIKSIPDYIRKLPSLHTLELGALPHVRELPSWLGEAGVNPLALSRNTFRIQDCRFSLSKQETEGPWQLVRLVHRSAMRKVETSDFEGALAALEVGSLEVLELDGFLLQEKGIVRRMMGDLHGALEDLTAALECLSKAGEGHCYTYDCWKHRGYVKFLMGDPKGAESDGTMALKLEIEGRREYLQNFFPIYHVVYYGDVFKSLGQEPIRYMNFTFREWREMIAHQKLTKLMYSSHDEAMHKVKALDFQGALASFDVIEVALLPDDYGAFFLQERGILKRLTGNLDGALEDLTMGLELMDNDYDRYKHRDYVKFLLGDLNGARMDAEKCLTLEGEETEHEYLGGTPVAFLEFDLK